MKTCCLCHKEKSTSAFAKDSGRLDGLQPRCRECQAQLTAAWREANRELLRQKSTIYRAENPEKRKASVLAWDMANRERNNARHRANYAADPEKHKAQDRAYHKDHREQDTARMARWRAANPDRAREGIRRYRTLKLNAYVAPVDFEFIYQRDKGLCQICLKPVERTRATLDHIIPLARGGTHEPNNVQIAHGSCNSSKGVRILTKSGYLLR